MKYINEDLIKRNMSLTKTVFKKVLRKLLTGKSIMRISLPIIICNNETTL